MSPVRHGAPSAVNTALWKPSTWSQVPNKISAPTFSGWARASSCATQLPSDQPSTSACSMNSASISAATSSAMSVMDRAPFPRSDPPIPRLSTHTLWFAAATDWS